MVHNPALIWLASGAWFAGFAGIAAGSLALGASTSSMVLILLVCAAPIGIARVAGIGRRTPSRAPVLERFRQAGSSADARLRAAREV